jgi:ABC-type multidrug transport system fused ATPase/permease subunit
MFLKAKFHLFEDRLYRKATMFHGDVKMISPKTKSDSPSSELVTLREIIGLFANKDRRKILLVVSVQVFLGLLDLIGVALIGVLSALAINGLQSRPAGDRVSRVLEFVNLGDQTLQVQATVLGIAAAAVLIVKTFASIFFTRRTLYFLGRRSAYFARNLLSQIFSKNILAIQGRSHQDFVYAITAGMSAATLGVIGTLILLISDVSLVLILSVGLFILDPKVAILSTGLFSCIGLVLYLLLKKRAISLGEAQASLSVRSNENIVQALLSYRELLVHDRRDFITEMIAKDRMKLSDASAEISFLPNISKYVLEVSIVIGALVISAFQFITADSVRAISILSVFLAASTRLAPAILRIQQGSTSIKANLSNSQRTIDLIRAFGILPRELRSSANVVSSYQGFNPDVQLNNLSFKYPTQEEQTIDNVSLSIPAGKLVAFVGPSGGGKSTLIDLLLGVLDPDMGSVSISGKDPLSAIIAWPGAISYVPQETNLLNGSILENITFGYDKDSFDEKDVHQALSMAQLSDFVAKLPNGIHSQIGDRGSRLSGGQKQRVGLARALFTKPKLLVLDEATSALDGETEANFSEALQSMRGSITILLIAHRLATVRNADLVYYMDEGRVIAQGTFEEVKSLAPHFAHQAALLGL